MAAVRQQHKVVPIDLQKFQLQKSTLEEEKFVLSMWPELFVKKCLFLYTSFKYSNYDQSSGGGERMH